MPRLISDLSITAPKRSFGSVFFWGERLAVVGLGLLLLSWLVPNHYRPWPSFHSEMMAFAAMTFLLASRLLQQEQHLVWPRLAIGLLCVSAMPWFQWALGLSPFFGDALVVLLYMAAFVGAIAIGYSRRDAALLRPGSVPALLLVILAAALLSTFIASLQWFGLTGPYGDLMIQAALGERVMSNLAQSNHFSTLVLMGGVAAIGLFDRGVLGRTAAGLCLALLTLGLVLSLSRSGALGALVVSGYLICKRRDWKSRWPAYLVPLWVLGFVLLTWAFPYVSDMLMVSGQGLELGNSSGRVRMWEQLLHGIWQSPWWGYGWNLTGRAQMAVAADLPATIPTDYAHNVLLDLLAWNGIPIGTALIVAGGYWVISRLLKVKGPDAVYAMAGLLPILVHSMVEYPFAYAYFLLPAGVLVGVVEASLPSGQPLRCSAKVVWTCLAVWAVVGTVFIYEYFLIEEDFRVTRFENMRIGKTPDDYEVPEIHLATHMGAMLKATRLYPKPGMTPQEMDLLREVSGRFGLAALNYRYASALALNGEPQEAQRTMTMIRGMYGLPYYRQIKEEWLQEAEHKYPQLRAVELP